MEPQQVIADYQQRAAQIGAKARAIQAEIAAIRGVETSGDGAVTVTVNVQGGIEKLSFGPAASDLPLDALGQAIVATSRKARARAARSAAQAVEPLVGAGSPAMQELRERLPSDPSLDEGVDRPGRDGLNEEQVEPTAAPAEPDLPVTPPPPAAPSRPTPPAPSPAVPVRAAVDDDVDDASTGYTRGG